MTALSAARGGIRDFVQAEYRLRRARQEVQRLHALAGPQDERETALRRATLELVRAQVASVAGPSDEADALAAAIAGWLGQQDVDREALGELAAALDNIDLEAR